MGFFKLFIVIFNFLGAVYAFDLFVDSRDKMYLIPCSLHLLAFVLAIISIVMS